MHAGGSLKQQQQSSCIHWPASRSHGKRGASYSGGKPQRSPLPAACSAHKRQGTICAWAAAPGETAEMLHLTGGRPNSAAARGVAAARHSHRLGAVCAKIQACPAARETRREPARPDAIRRDPARPGASRREIDATRRELCQKPCIR